MTLLIFTTVFNFLPLKSMEQLLQAESWKTAFFCSFINKASELQFSRRVMAPRHVSQAKSVKETRDQGKDHVLDCSRSGGR